MTGATGGIGGATVLKALEHGATVIAAARNQNKMDDLRQRAGENADRLLEEMVDLSLVSDTHTFAKRLAARTEKIDVLVNNVGILNTDHGETAEGFETTYGVNLLNHHQLTEAMFAHGKFNAGARVIEVSSGGMYNAPLNTVMLDQKAEHFNGKATYSSHKRAQMVLTDHYRQKHSEKGLKFYAMHPGWVDTDTVKTGLPVFRALLWPILRTGTQGADTINWIGATAPEEVEDKIWFDRKPRSAHAFKVSRKPKVTPAELVAYLEADIEKHLPQSA